MKCDKCTNSLKGKTGVPSCWLPRCPHDWDILMKEYLRYAARPSRTPAEQRRMWAIEQEIRQQIHDEIDEHWHG